MRIAPQLMLNGKGVARAAAAMDRVAGHLAECGSVPMPLDADDVSPRVAVLQDRIGVSRQIMQVPR